MDDELSLAARAARQDSAALGAIYDLYSSRIYAYLYRRLGDRSLAEDLTGEVFLRMLEASRSAHFARTSLTGWLYRIAHNLVVDHFRRSGSEEVALDETSPAVNSLAALSTEQAETQAYLRAAIGTLTEDQQQVITLRFGEGLTARQVAEALGKPETAVCALQHRGLAALRRALEGERR